jgi:hypothetical protein
MQFRFEMILYNPSMTLTSTLKLTFASATLGGLLVSAPAFAQWCDVVDPGEPVIVAVTTGDADGDGDNDLFCIALVPSPGGGFDLVRQLLVFLNDGQGGFNLTGSVPTTIGVTTLAAGDLDGDGDDDVVIGGIDSRGYGVGVFLSDGTGGVGFRSSHPAIKALDVTLGDLEGDGDLDIVAGGLSGPITTLRNDGAAGFGAPIETNYPANTDSIAVADWSGDGLLDLAFSYPAEGLLYAARGLGDGAFDPIPDVFALSTLDVATRGVQIAELTGDGRLDLVVAVDVQSVAFDDEIVVFAGNDSGSFDLASRMVVTDGPWRLAAIGSASGGAAQLFLSSVESQLVTILEAVGDAPLEIVEVFSHPGDSPPRIAPADFDDDGVVDFASRVDGDLLVRLGDCRGVRCDLDLVGNDQFIGAGELAVLIGEWDIEGSPADLDGSGRVDARDLALLIGAWGDCTAAP